MFKQVAFSLSRFNLMHLPHKSYIKLIKEKITASGKSHRSATIYNLTIYENKCLQHITNSFSFHLLAHHHFYMFVTKNVIWFTSWSGSMVSYDYTEFFQFLFPGKVILIFRFIKLQLNFSQRPMIHRNIKSSPSNSALSFFCVLPWSLR